MSKMLNKDEKFRIEMAINNSMDTLEDVLNASLRDIIDEMKIKDEEAIVYAREVFFKG